MNLDVRARLSGCLFGFAAVQYLVAEAATAFGFDGYRYVRDTVSELGVPASSPGHLVMNGAFCVSAVTVLVAGKLTARLLSRRRAKVYLGAVVAYSVGSVLVASVHAGDGSAHVLGAILAIGAGNVIAVTVGTGVPTCPRWYSASSVALGAAGFAASILLVAGIGPVGAVERASIYTFTAWELVTAAALFRSAVSRNHAELRS
ncbi:MAG: DUF998 domain-containing protein [Rhodococcus sp. (in: high G+C Gram-positive bacteria)]